MYDYAIINGEIVTASWRGKANLGIKNGRITAISSDALHKEANETFDAAEKTIIPALVDGHVHLRDPGYTDKEDFFTGTCAAAAGGYGTVVAQPNTDPPVIDAKRAKTLISLGKRKSVVDFSISAQVTPNNLNQLSQLKEAGVIIFDAASCDIPDQWILREGDDLWRLFKDSTMLGVPVAFYASDSSLINRMVSTLMNEGRNDPLAWSDSRPPVTEVAEIARVSRIAAASGVSLLFRQVSTRESLEMLRVVNSSIPKQKIKIEVNPHHLFLDSEDLKRLGPFAKMAPPLRDRGTVRSLWQYLHDGYIDLIGGDHAPHTWREKNAGRENIWESASGVPTLETSLPLMLDVVSRGDISIEQVVRLMSEGPARWLGLYPLKGTIAVGSDADIVILDLKSKWEIRGTQMRSKCKWTPYEGRKITGRVENTMIRGKWVFSRDRILVEAGFGKFIEVRQKGS